jgi:uncharacterized protein YigE (DUF2233 family)
MKRVRLPVFFIFTLWLVFISSKGFAQSNLWNRVGEGLYLKEFDSPRKSGGSDAKITIVKIDPAFYAFRLLCASEHGRSRMTVKEWCKRFHLVSGINAGMYQKDGITNVGYMKNFGHTNNPRLNSSYKTVLAFNRIASNVPEIQIIDLKCQDFNELSPKYQTFVQNIRMLSCFQENVWAKQDKMWSMAVLGIDKSGKVLFIFTEVPYSGYEFANLLLSLPISIHNAMYLEGGSEASLYFSADDIEFERVGVREIEFRENNEKAVSRSVPNVIGIVKKTK